MGQEVEYIESPKGSNYARIKLYLVMLSLCIICIIGIFNAIYIIARASYVISSIFGFKVALIYVLVHVDEFVLSFFGKRHQNVFRRTMITLICCLVLLDPSAWSIQPMTVIKLLVITEEVIIDVQNMKYVQSSSSHLSLLPVSLFVWSAVTSVAVKNWLDSLKVSQMTAVKELSQKN